jgi:hypothetical protein
MHGPINVRFPNNISKWQMGFNLASKGLIPTPSSDKLTEVETIYGYSVLNNVKVRTEKLSVAVPAGVFGKRVIFCRL